jgi:hypothetical protein
MMKTTHQAMMVMVFLLLFPVFAVGGQVYKWVDERGTFNLTDDPQKVPERFRNRAEVLTVPDKYAEPPVRAPVPEKPAIAYEPEPERPKPVEEKPPSAFIPFDKYKHLTEGMTEAELLSRVGPPSMEVGDEVESRGVFRGRGLRRGLFSRQALVKRYYYIGDPDLGERTTIIHLSNGVIRRIERIFPPTW